MRLERHRRKRRQEDAREKLMDSKHCRKAAEANCRRTGDDKEDTQASRSDARGGSAQICGGDPRGHDGAAWVRVCSEIEQRGCENGRKTTELKLL